MQRQIAGQLKSLPGRMRPAFSSLEPQNQSYSASNDEPRDYYIFHNVMLLVSGCGWFVNDADMPAELDVHLLHNQHSIPGGL